MTTKVKSAIELATMLKGELVGSEKIAVSGVSSLLEAGVEHVSFLGNKKYISQVATTDAGVVLLPKEFEGAPKDGCAWIMVDDPSSAFSVAVELFAPEAVRFNSGVDDKAVVDPSVVVPESVHVGPFAVVRQGVVIGENVVIGAGCYVGDETTLANNCFLYPNVSIRERVRLGENVIVHCGSVIGSDGFGYVPGAAGHTKIPQVGIVQIDDNVEIGANVTIDRARFGRTWIKEGAKIDNLVHVAHNVIVGRHCFIVAQVGIAGSTVLGDGVIAAGQAGFSGHLEIGAGAVVMGQAGVTKDLSPKQVVFGTPAIPRKEFVKQSIAISKIKKLEQRIKDLEAER